MNTIDITQRKIIVAGAWKVWGAIIDNFSCDFNNILVGNSTGNYKWHQAYKIGELDKTSDISEWSIGIIASVWEWVEKALEDFGSKNIPTVLLSTAYREELLNKYTNMPILKAPNLALPIVELIAIFENFHSFIWLDIQIQESHQSWKKDPSWTARKLIKIINSKGWKFNLDYIWYEPNEWISILGDLITYRWNVSKSLWIPDESLDGHAYHHYDVRWSTFNSAYMEFINDVEAWSEKYKDHDITWFDIWFKRWTQVNFSVPFSFHHNVDGRDIYADGLREILPWFLEQEAWIHEVTDYLIDSNND